MKRNPIVLSISSLLVLLFAYAAFSKLGNYDTFVFQLRRSPFITAYAPVTAWSLPAGELLTALALIVPATRLLGLFASVFLMALFTAYVFTMIHFSYYVPCSCGGILSDMGWNTHLIFNVGCLGVALAGVILWMPQSPGASIKQTHV